MFIRHHQFIISLSTIITVLFIIVILIICPALRDILTINSTISQEKEILEQKLALGLNIKTTENLLKSIDQTQPLLESAFIRQGQELEFITTIEQLAVQNKVTLELKPDFTGKAINPEVSEVAIEINAVGDYPTLQDFLKAIEHLPYYYTTEALVISQSNSSASTTMQFLGKAYLLK